MYHDMTVAAYFAFLSTPSGWRATLKSNKCLYTRRDFYPRPPGGGRRGTISSCAFAVDFYPRPPGGGRPPDVVQQILSAATISIHALRVEGDQGAS